MINRTLFISSNATHHDAYKKSHPSDEVTFINKFCDVCSLKGSFNTIILHTIKIKVPFLKNVLNICEYGGDVFIFGPTDLHLELLMSSAGFQVLSVETHDGEDEVKCKKPYPNKWTISSNQLIDI